jgi:hypothetical protein
MKRNAWIAAAITASMLTAGTAVAESGVKPESRAKVQMVRAATAPAPARRVIAFQTQRTDSWLCNYVSVFFCSDVIPQLDTTTPGELAAKVPDRSRKSGQ